MPRMSIYMYSTEHKEIEKLTATAPQPFYIVLLCTTFLNIAKHGEKTMTFQFTGTAPEPEINSI